MDSTNWVSQFRKHWTANLNLIQKEPIVCYHKLILLRLEQFLFIIRYTLYQSNELFLYSFRWCYKWFNTWCLVWQEKIFFLFKVERVRYSQNISINCVLRLNQQTTDMEPIHIRNSTQSQSKQKWCQLKQEKKKKLNNKSWRLMFVTKIRY